MWIRNPVLYPPELRGHIGETYCMTSACMGLEDWDSSENEAIVAKVVAVCKGIATPSRLAASLRDRRQRRYDNEQKRSGSYDQLSASPPAEESLLSPCF